MKNIILIICIFQVINLFSQKDPDYVFYNCNMMAYNPGAAKSFSNFEVDSYFQQQQIGLENNPTTFLFSAQKSIFNKTSGIGLNVIINDDYLFKNLHSNINYAYEINIKNSLLRIGIGLGILHNILKEEWVTTEITNSKKTNFDANIGLLYILTFTKYKQLILGLSSTHITNPLVVENQINENMNFPRTYYLSGQYRYDLPNGLISLLPSVLIKTDLINTESRFSLYSKININGFWLIGLSYSTNKSVNIMLGLDGKSTIGISYDIMFGTPNIGGAFSIILRSKFWR